MRSLGSKELRKFILHRFRQGGLLVAFLFLLFTVHYSLSTSLFAQEIVTSTPIHNRAYDPKKALFELKPAGNQTGDSQEWKDAAGNVVTWVDKDGVLHALNGGGITSINGLTAFAQFLTVGCKSGTDVNIQPNVDTNVFCFPDASATARGLVTTGAQVYEGHKVFNVDLATNGAFSALGISSQAQSNISTVTFTGAGLNDLTAGGTYTADNSLAYCVKIDGTAPDTFSWGTGGSCVNGALTVAITGAAQTLSNGITVTFVAVLGHTLTNQWDFVVSEVAPLALADATGTPLLTCHNSGAGCPMTGFPRLDQVATQPVLADSPFAMGTNILEFDWGNTAWIFSPTNGLSAFVDTPFGNGLDIEASNSAVGGSGNTFGISTRASNSGTADIALYGLFVESGLNYGAGTVRYNYGIWVDDQTTSRVNYSIQTNLAPYGGNALGDRLTIKSNAAAVQPITFTGAGLNDATSGGTFIGLDDLAYCVQIDASVPSPDTFEWGTGGSCSNGATGVNITGAAQTLSNGVQITFAAIDGHTIGDNWTFTAYAPIPLTLQDHNGNITAKVRETGDVLARRFHASTGTALVAGDFTTAGWQTGSGGLGTITGTDQAFQFTMTATAPNITLNPTVTLTFHDGTWTTVPIFVCNQNGGTGAQSFVTVVPTATQAVITYLGTPITTLTYVISCVGMGI